MSNILNCIYSYFKNKTIEVPKINIELIPYEAQGFNVRSRLRPYDWEKICTIVHKQGKPKGSYSAYRCMQCGEQGRSQGFPHPVECHEVWEFDETTRTQKLLTLISICPLCHKAKHYGLSKKMGMEDRVREHIMKHNNWNEKQLDKYINTCIEVVKEKSGKMYRLDLTWLNQPKFYFLQTQFTTDETTNCDTNIRY